MADYKRKTQSDNKHLSNLTSARMSHVSASTTETIRNGACRLIRVVLNTNGGVVIIRDGTEVIATIALDAPEGPFEYGGYIATSLICEVGATADVTVVWDE